MSVDYHVYFGPYLVLSNPTKTIIEPERACPNDKCEKFKRQAYDKELKFCPTCGEKITSVGVEKKRPSHSEWLICENLRGALTPAFGDSQHPDSLKEKMVLIPNRKFGIERNCWLSLYNDSPMELNIQPNQSSEECYAFTTTFSKEIEYLTSLFGKNAIALRWGMLMYAN